MKILVADDSIVSRHLLDATLRRWGYEVVVACDGNEAWHILQQDGAPSVAILDWMMPGHTGVEVCRMVRQQSREPYIYILLLTSKSLKEDLIEGMEAGADDYITKPFDQHELKVRLRAGTRLVELQAQLLSAREALREQATKDWLTKVWNRSSILDLLSRELARSGREARPVGLVLVDLDHFKNVNDTLGHFAGDAVLREAAVRMLSAIRPYDSVGRYGGEEFLILLPGCDEQATCGLAERVRVQIAKDGVTAGETTLSLTASFGATSVMARQGITAEDLIRKADAAMYLAKRLGRNRVELLPFDSVDAVPAAPSVETIAR